MIIFWAILFFFIIFPKDAHAYIDPGYGSYLISSIAAAVMSFFAFVSAFIVHFYRKFVLVFLKGLWQKHRGSFIISLALLVMSLIYAIFFFQWEPIVFSNSTIERASAKFDPHLTGAYVHDASRISPGYNLYDGKLIDNSGHTIKRWSSVFMGTLDTNGDYYAQQYYQSPLWGRYTWDDKVIWEKKMTIHHQILLTPQNTVIVFTKEMHVYKGRKVDFDVVIEFDKEGRELHRYSTWDHFGELFQYHGPLPIDRHIKANAPDDYKKSPWGGHFDYYHMNFLSLVPENPLKKINPIFKTGNWVISFRHGDMIFIVDPDSGKIAGHIFPPDVPDGIQGVHATQMLPNGHLIILDNGTYRRWSRVIEFDLTTGKILWEYHANGFFSYTQSHIQVLPNGNMLVTESEKGHVFELTREKKIVWEFYQPERQNTWVTKDSLSDQGLDADKVFNVLMAHGWLKPISNSQGMLTQRVSSFRKQLEEIFPDDFMSIYYVLKQYEDGKYHQYREEIYRMRRYPVSIVGPLLKH